MQATDIPLIELDASIDSKKETKLSVAESLGVICVLFMLFPQAGIVSSS